MAERLRVEADSLIDEWLESLTDGVGIHPAGALPREAIIDHLPHVIRGIAEFLVNPAESVKTELTAHVRAHARTRREQGYDIEELTLEYEGLNRIVSKAMVQALREYPSAVDPIEVAHLFIRLLDGLSEFTNVTVSTYRQEELDYERARRQELSEFARLLAHELKNPLQAISAATHMLEDPELVVKDDERERFLELIKRGITHVRELSDDILLLSRGENLPEHEEPVQLRNIVQGIITELQPLASEKDVEVSIEEPLPEIELGSARAELALVNLLSNAIKYSDPDKSDRWVRIGARPLENDRPRFWEVYVADNGLGIPRHLQDRIMERQFRAHPNVAEGTGLGLSIAREAVEQRGGRIWFESREKEGSTFHFTIDALGTARQEMPEGNARRM